MKRKIIIIMCVVATLVASFALPIYASITATPNVSYSYTDEDIGMWQSRVLMYRNDTGPTVDMEPGFIANPNIGIGTNTGTNVEKPIGYMEVSPMSLSSMKWTIQMPDMWTNPNNPYVTQTATYRMRFGIWLRAYSRPSNSMGCDIECTFYQGAYQNVTSSYARYVETNARGMYYLVDMYIDVNPAYYNNSTLEVMFRPFANDNSIYFTGEQPRVQNSFYAITALHIETTDVQSVVAPYPQGTLMKYPDMINNKYYYVILNEGYVVNNQFSIDIDGTIISFTTDQFTQATYFLHNNNNNCYVYVPLGKNQGWLYDGSVVYGSAYEEIYQGNSNPVYMYQLGYDEATKISQQIQAGIIQDYENKIAQIYQNMPNTARESYNRGYNEGFAKANNAFTSFTQILDKTTNLVRVGIVNLGKYTFFGVNIPMIIIGTASAVSLLALAKKLKS